VVAGLEDFEKQYGLRFHPADKLYELVKDGHLGEKTKSGFLEYV
jgi:3-hydroxyacyl-CoA dehydrogenase